MLREILFIKSIKNLLLMYNCSKILSFGRILGCQTRLGRAKT